MPLVGRDMIVGMHVLSEVRLQPRKTVVDGGTKGTAKKPSLGMCYMWKTLVGLAVLLGSCFRRNDECWILAQSLSQERRMLGFLHGL